MTNERRLLYVHKLLHEEVKHRQETLKTMQKEQVKAMTELLDALDIEDSFAAFCKRPDPAFLACRPNACPTEEEIAALSAMGITALCFPCIRLADNGKSAMGMWLAETGSGLQAIAAEFLRWGEEWKLWKLILSPTTDNLPAEPYERKYPDPREMPPAPMPAGSPGGPPPGGPPPGGPGGEDAPPFDPDARSDVFDMEGDYARLTADITILATMALPDYRKGCEEANALMEQCRRVVSPGYAAERVKRSL